MKELIFSFATVLAAATSPQPVEKATTSSYTNSPIVGLWQLEFRKPVDNCTEVYNFKADNNLSVVSGAEWTMGKYRYISSDDGASTMLYLKTEIDDNNTDCSGVKEDQSGQSFVSYVKHESPTRFSLCVDQETKECFMTLNKILP